MKISAINNSTSQRPIAYVNGRYIFPKKFAVQGTRNPVKLRTLEALT